MVERANRRVMESRIFRTRGASGYLGDQDRYLSAHDATILNYGFIGCGMMGQEHMRNTLLAGRARVHGLFDPAAQSLEHARQQVLKKQDGEAPVSYRSLEEACTDPATDALIIATPNFTHLEVMRQAVKSSKAIFLEKPIATSVDDAYEVCQLAASHPYPVRFGLQYRYKAIYAEAIEEVFERQAIGRVHSVNMLEHRFPFLDKVNQWNKFNAYTGGTLVEKCCHYFDLLNLFAGGTPKRVFAVGNQAVNFREFSYANRPADGLDQAQVTVEYDNGVIGGFSLCMFAPGAREELVVCGDAGRLHASEEAQLGDGNQNLLQVWRGENGASRTTCPTYPSYIARAGHHGSTFFEHLAFSDDVITGENPKTLAATRARLADGFWSVALGAASQVSIERKEAVDVAELLPLGFAPIELGVPATVQPIQAG